MYRAFTRLEDDVKWHPGVTDAKICAVQHINGKINSVCVAVYFLNVYSMHVFINVPADIDYTIVPRPLTYIIHISNKCTRAAI